jgi:hypothetical protein
VETNFDLQLFAEGEESAADVGAVNTEGAAESQPEPSPEPTPDAVPDVMLRIDPATGRREFLTGDEIQPKQEESSTEPVNEPTTNAYSANDLFRDFAMGRVDEARIPKELEGYYNSIKTQQENAQLRQQAAIREMQIQQQAPAQPTPPVDNTANMVAAYQQMEKYARDKAFHDLGIDGEEDLSQLQYSDNPEDKQRAAVFNTAVQQNMQLIGQAVAEQQARAQAEQQATRQELELIRNGVVDYQKNEPHFNEIDQLMGVHWQSMPYEQAQRYIPTLNRVVQVFQGQPGARLMPNDKDVLNEYYQECKKAFYAKQTGVGTTPQPVKSQVPNVEHSGQATSAPEPKVDWSAMRSMNPRQRREFFMSHIQ